MKKSNQCPKCNSKDVILITGGSFWGVRRNEIPVASPAKFIPVTRYLCGTCGYSEEWVDDKKDVAYLKAKFKE